MIRIGVVGTGGMANGHAAAFQGTKGVTVTACCDVVEEKAGAFAEKHKIARIYTDYRKMLRDEALDGITNVTTDAMHAPISIAALRAGVHVLCEKPMAPTLAEARRMARAAKESRRINMIHFSKRNAAGLQAAKTLIRQGKIGRILHVEASYFQGWLAGATWDDWRRWPHRAWRLSTRHGSQGVLGDLGCHIYDMAHVLCGDIATIDCRLATYKKGVRGERMGEYVFDANDSFVSTVVFANGAIGTVASSRWCTGHSNREFITVYGDRGAVEVDFEKGPNTYRFAKLGVNGKPAWQEVTCKPVPSLYTRFIRAIRSGRQDPCDFANGLKVQAYLHYSFASDARGRALKVKV